MLAVYCLITLAACAGSDQQAALHDAASKYQAALGHYVQRIAQDVQVVPTPPPGGAIDPSTLSQWRYQSLVRRHAEVQALEKELRTITFPASLHGDVANLFLEMDESAAFDSQLIGQGTSRR